jgi:phosphoglycerate dehydrogenase-like enzyme
VIGTRRAAGTLPHVERVYAPAETDEVLAHSDFVVLLLPATPETENIINAARLSHMKKTAWLLNFGRGALIDDAALVAAAKSGTIAGAILDVFRQEPLPKEDPFWSKENILVLPHIGGLHPARDSMVAALLVENLRRFLDGAPLKEVVDRKAGY